MNHVLLSTGFSDYDNAEYTIELAKTVRTKIYLYTYSPFQTIRLVFQNKKGRYNNLFTKSCGKTCKTY
jgi:hypothetical protein